MVGQRLHDALDDVACPDCDSEAELVPVDCCLDCGRLQLMLVVRHDETCPWMQAKLRRFGDD